MDSTKVALDYSNRRPADHAWRAAQNGHTTYAPQKERAIELHQEKLEIYKQIDELLELCAACSAKRRSELG